MNLTDALPNNIILHVKCELEVKTRNQQFLTTVLTIVLETLTA
jgi:hypothetical protein